MDIARRLHEGHVAGPPSAPPRSIRSASLMYKKKKKLPSVVVSLLPPMEQAPGSFAGELVSFIFCNMTATCTSSDRDGPASALLALRLLLMA